MKAEEINSLPLARFPNVVPIVNERGYMAVLCQDLNGIKLQKVAIKDLAMLFASLTATAPITSITPATLLAPAYESLTTGQFVNLFLSNGRLQAREASSRDSERSADGFVLADTAAGVMATVYTLSSFNTGFTGLTPGADYYLSECGTVSDEPPTYGIVQFLGRAISATTLPFTNNLTVELA